MRLSVWIALCSFTLLTACPPKVEPSSNEGRGPGGNSGTGGGGHSGTGGGRTTPSGGGSGGSDGSGGAGGNSSKGTGTVRGKVTVFTGAKAKALSARSVGVGVPGEETPMPSDTAQIQSAAKGFSNKPAEPFVKGDVLVKTKSELRVKELILALKPATAGLSCVYQEAVSSRWHRIHCDRQDAGLSLEETKQLVERVKSVDAIEASETNGIVFAQAIPDDPNFTEQWHYPAMRLPQAWNISIGKASVVVAVLDSGIVKHEDLDENVLPGYDFVADANNARDGDGRDNNPTEELLPAGQNQSFHGTHVAGTISARTNNKIGVSGVAGNVKVLPVRVLGAKGGTNADIVAGIYWSIGVEVPQVPTNPTPAQVINMSLGGDSAPSQVYQDAIDEAVRRNVVVVIAAGNENEDTANKSPCNQRNVVCVGATDFAENRAPYSNTGAEVTLTAPGGDTGADLNGDGYADGVLSTTIKNGYRFLQGTSMATPHVAGVVALLKSMEPNLSVEQTVSILKKASLPMANCKGCGVGRLMADAALAQLQGGHPAAGLTLSPSGVVVTKAKPQVTLTLSNSGADTVKFEYTSASTQRAAVDIQDPAATEIAAGSSIEVVVTVDFNQLTVGEADIDLNIDEPGEGGATLATTILKIRPDAEPPPPAVVALLEQDANEEWVVVAKTLSDKQGNYVLNAPEGDYLLLAVVDANGNGELEKDEPVGAWPTIDSWKPLKIVANKTKSDVNFSAAPEAGTK